MNYIVQKEHEFIRDWTGLANPLTLGLIGALAFGGIQSSIFWQMVLVWIFNELGCSLIKLVWYRPRPVPIAWSNWYEKINASSFPSIHAARLAVFATFCILSERFDLYTLWIIITAALVVGITRVVLKKHYWVDVIGGWVLGVLLTIVGVYILSLIR